MGDPRLRERARDDAATAPFLEVRSRTPVSRRPETHTGGDFDDEFAALGIRPTLDAPLRELLGLGDVGADKRVLHLAATDILRGPAARR